MKNPKSNINNLRGSIVAIITPFKEDGSIDFESFEKLINFQIDNGTNGIVVCGTTGETPALEEEEYKKIIKFTVDKVDKQIPVIAGSGTNSTSHSINLSQIAKEAGADGLLVVGPYYNKPTPMGFYYHFSEIAKSTNLPIIIYNVPGRTGKNIPTNILLKLATEFENIIGVKEASGDMAQIMEIINQKPNKFKVFSGDDVLAFNVCALGGDGCISVVANEIPKQFSEMMKLALEGNLAEAKRLHFKYLNLMNFNFIESNPIPVKTALHLMGMINEVFRLPMCSMEDSNRGKLKAEMQSVGLI